MPTSSRKETKAPPKPAPKAAPKAAAKAAPKAPGKAPTTVVPGTVIIPPEKLDALVKQAEELTVTLKSLRVPDEEDSASESEASSASD